MLPAFRKRKFPNPGHTQATPFQSESLFPQRVACGAGGGTPGNTHQIKETPFQSESLFPQRVACGGWHGTGPRQATPRQHLFREFFLKGRQLTF